MARTLFLCIFLYLPLNAQVTFSEIMYNPATSEFHDEFIEVKNISSETVDLNGWMLFDSLSHDALTDAGNGLLLGPGQFAVVLDGSYFENSSVYDGVIPDSALILTIADKGFGSNGLSNSSARPLTLLDSSGAIISRYRYQLGYTPGFSAEKIRPDGTNDSTNWGMSLQEGGTPGRRNSLSPFPYDLAIGNVTFTPRTLLQTGQPATFDVAVFNAGTQIFIQPVDLLVYEDTNQNGFYETSERLLYNKTLNREWSVADTVVENFSVVFDEAGRYEVRVEISSEADQQPANDAFAITVVVSAAENRLRINEVKFLTEDDEPEWIELYNDGDESVLLNNFAFADSRDTLFLDSLVIMPPGSFRVLAESGGLDTLYGVPESLIIVPDKWNTLNNSEDVLYMLGPDMGWLEQVPYNIDWLQGEEWRTPSLERINPRLDARLSRNWGPSTAQHHATPGRQNAIYTSVTGEGDLKLDISPNPFSPDGDGHEDHAVISLELPVESARIRLEIFDIRGRSVVSISDNRFSGKRHSLVWDGRDKQGRKAPMGIYIVFLQVLNSRDGVIKEIKESIVLAGKL